MNFYLTEWLEEKGMTQEELIEKCDNKKLVSQNYLNRWIDGTSSPSLRAADLMASAMSITIDTLLHKTPEDVQGERSECKIKENPNPTVCINTKNLKAWMRVLHKTIEDIDMVCKISLADNPGWNSESITMHKEDFETISDFLNIWPEVISAESPREYYENLEHMAIIATRKHKVACRLIKYFRTKGISYNASMFRMPDPKREDIYYIAYSTTDIGHILEPFDIIRIGMNPKYRSPAEYEDAPWGVKYSMINVCDFLQL